MRQTQWGMGKALFDFVADRLIGFTHQSPEFLGKVILRTALPTKSNTVQHSLSFASRRPRPNCCKKMVRLSVGRKTARYRLPGYQPLR